MEHLRDSNETVTNHRTSEQALSTELPAEITSLLQREPHARGASEADTISETPLWKIEQRELDLHFQRKLSHVTGIPIHMIAEGMNSSYGVLPTFYGEHGKARPEERQWSVKFTADFQKVLNDAGVKFQLDAFMKPSSSLGFAVSAESVEELHEAIDRIVVRTPELEIAGQLPPVIVTKPEPVIGVASVTGPSPLEERAQGRVPITYSRN